MKTTKKVIAVILSILFITASFAGCSSKTEEKYSASTLIIGYTGDNAPFLTVDKDGNATGFEADLMAKIFNDIKGDYKNYVFEKVDKGYVLEEDGGFFDSKGNEYSAEVLLGGQMRDQGAFNETYKITQNVISNRIIAVTTKNSKVKSYSDFKGVNAVVVSDLADKTFESNKAISSVCKSIAVAKDTKTGIDMIKSGKADVLIIDEFDYMPSKDETNLTVIDSQLDTINYVIACSKKSKMNDTINEAIKELKSKEYNNADEFTPIVEKYFNYNASSFEYEPETK